MSVLGHGQIAIAKDATIMLEYNSDFIALAKVVTKIPGMNFVLILVVIEFAFKPYNEFFSRQESFFEFFGIQPLGPPPDDLEFPYYTTTFQYDLRRSCLALVVQYCVTD